MRLTPFEVAQPFANPVVKLRLLDLGRVGSAVCRTVDSIYSLNLLFYIWLAPQEFMHFPLLHRAFSNRGKAFHFRQMTRPPLALPPSGLPFLPMLCSPAQAYHASRLRRFRQTVFASSAILPAGCIGGCPSLLRSVRLWITGTNVVE